MSLYTDIHTVTTARKARWPKRSDYVRLSRDQALAIVTSHTKIHGLAKLRAHRNFGHFNFNNPRGIEDCDLPVAVNIVLATAVEDGALPSAQILRTQMERHFGSLEEPIAFAVGKWSAVYVPGADVE